METESKANVPRNTPWIFKGGVLFLLGLCICTLCVYAADSGLSGQILTALLWILQFLAVFLTVLSLCGLGFSVWRIVCRRQFRFIFFMGLYLLSGFFGAFLAFFGRFMLTAAGGN